MKMNDIMVKASRFAAKAKFKLGKHSPEILMVCGAVGAVTSAVMACKATLKVNDIMSAHQSSVATIHDVKDGKVEVKEGAEYTEEDAKKDLTTVYVQTGVKLVKLYAPAVILGGLSLGCMIGSNRILQKRNAALTAAYVTLDKGASSVYAALPLVALLEVFGAALLAVAFHVHAVLFANALGLGGFTLLLAGALCIHFGLLLANTFIGTFVIHAALPLVATLDIHLTLLLGDAFAGLCTPASLKSTLRENQSIPALTCLGIGTMARGTLIVLISRVFLCCVEIAVLVFAAFVAHKFPGIVPVIITFCTLLAVCKVIPVVHFYSSFVVSCGCERLSFTASCFYPHSRAILA